MPAAYKGLVQTTQKSNTVAGTAILIRRADMGFDPSQLIASTQINCEGLGGGTFDVNLVVPGCESVKSHQTALTTLDSVIVLPEVIFEALQITFAGAAGLQTVIVNSRKVY